MAEYICYLYEFKDGQCAYSLNVCPEGYDYDKMVEKFEQHNGRFGDKIFAWARCDACGFNIQYIHLVLPINAARKDVLKRHHWVY